MSTTEIGRAAEDLVAQELRKRGHKIIDQNWRTRWCEVDIVAQKSRTIYFVEVKYRKSNIWGDGLAAITNKKLQQMSFAAELWVTQHNWKYDYQLMAANVSGVPPQITDLLLV